MTTPSSGIVRSPRLQRIRRRLERLYGPDQAERLLRRLQLLLTRYQYHLPASGMRHQPRWTAVDNVLITYGDSIISGKQKPLHTLNNFLCEHLKGVIDTVHILPFYPWSSDDGFSVIDYRKVDPALGGWGDITSIGESFRLMFDLVLNHCSRHSEWFRDYLMGTAPCNAYFHEMAPGTDLSAVVRPRQSPLLHPVQTRSGERWVWTTFSEDQVDLNFANPDVLLEFLDTLLFYITKGARIVRLDAVAYLWKQIGTSCIHLPQTHEIIKLMRDVLTLLAPHVLLLTETNVPHAENFSYFGEGDQAHMIYNFSLPPLLLHAMHSGSAKYLTRWASSLESPPPGCTFLNFTASHDGVGVRPLEGLVPRSQITRLCDTIKQLGGNVSLKSNPDGSSSPYELNITWWDAMRRPDDADDELRLARFMCSQTVALTLRGMPAVYIHSLLATPNDEQRVRQRGYPRAINRHQWSEADLMQRLADPQSSTRQVFDRYRRRLHLRGRQPAFHPDGPQKILDLHPSVLTVERIAPRGAQRLVALANLSDQPVTIQGDFPTTDVLEDGASITADGVTLGPYQCAWLSEH